MFNELYSPDKRITKMYNLTKIHKCHILKNRYGDSLYAIIKDCFLQNFYLKIILK